MLIVNKRFILEPSPLNLPIFSFMAVTAISLVWSNIFRDPLVITWQSFPFVQAASTVVMIMLPMALLMVANFIKDERILKILVGIMIIAGVLGIPRQLWNLRLLPTNTGGLYTMWVILYSAALGLFHRGLTNWQRTLLIVLAGIWVYWGFINISWMAGWLPGLIGLSIIIFNRSKKLAFWMMIAIVIIILLNFSAVSDYVIHVIEAETAESGETRLAAWIVNWGITKEHWLFGTGPAGYAAYYMSYFPMDGMATHSNYIDIVAQTGFAGLLLVLWIFFALAWVGYRLVLRLRGQGNFLEAAANAAFAGTIGCIFMMSFGDWLFPFAYTQSIEGFDYAVYNWVFLGTILVIDRLSTSK
jgi:O-antigen ligase